MFDWRKVILPAIASFVCFTSTAYGLDNIAPATNVYGDALLRSAIADTDKWWFSVSNQIPPSLELFVYDDDKTDKVAYGDLNSGSVFVSREIRNEIWDARNSRKALAYIWGMLAHERGHNLGLEHSVDVFNIMHPTASTVPRQAIKWAYSTARKFQRQVTYNLIKRRS